MAIQYSSQKLIRRLTAPGGGYICEGRGGKGPLSAEESDILATCINTANKEEEAPEPENRNRRRRRKRKSGALEAKTVEGKGGGRNRNRDRGRGRPRSDRPRSGQRPDKRQGERQIQGGGSEQVQNKPKITALEAARIIDGIDPNERDAKRELGFVAYKLHQEEMLRMEPADPDAKWRAEEIEGNGDSILLAPKVNGKLDEILERIQIDRILREIQQILEEGDYERLNRYGWKLKREGRIKRTDRSVTAIPGKEGSEEIAEALVAAFRQLSEAEEGARRSADADEVWQRRLKK